MDTVSFSLSKSLKKLDPSLLLNQVLQNRRRVLARLTACVLTLFQPIFLNEVLVKLPTDPSSDEPVFHISHIDRVYTLRTDNINERSVLTTCNLPEAWTSPSHKSPLVLLILHVQAP